MSIATLRDGTIGDLGELAVLDNIASHGMSLWFWQGAVMMGKADDAYDWGRRRLSDITSPFSWKNARVAELNGEVLGASIAYHFEHDGASAFSNEPEPLKPILELFAMAHNDWFLDSLAVYGKSRGTGVGRLLLNDFMSRGKKMSLNRASLVTEDSNMSAITLYKSVGFTERARRAFIPFNKESKSKNWLLLSAPLDQKAH